MIMRCGEQVCR